VWIQRVCNFLGHDDLVLVELAETDVSSPEAEAVLRDLLRKTSTSLMHLSVEGVRKLVHLPMNSHISALHLTTASC
jgi:hypothetical protein